MLLLSGCWQYLEPGMYQKADPEFVPEGLDLYNQAPNILYEEYFYGEDYFRLAILHSTREQLGIAFLIYRNDWYGYGFYDYMRATEDGDEPNFMLCDRRGDQFVCTHEEDGRLILGRVNDLDRLTLLGSGTDTMQGSLMNARLISFTYEFERTTDIAGGRDPSGDPVFSSGEWAMLQEQFDSWMSR